jgi:hypothetical protein
MPTDELLSTRARALAKAVEAFAAHYIFSPECHQAYAALGFAPSGQTTAGGVAMPEGISYLLARGSSLGQVPGELMASTFAAFNPELVAAGANLGRTMVDAATIADARDRGAIAGLHRILGEHPEGLERGNELMAVALAPLRIEGRPLFAGLVARGLPDDPLGAAWRRADMLREYRGDSHIAAWNAHGLDSIEETLLTEAWWGLGLKTYARTRLWSDEELEGAETRLTDRGLLAGGAITDAGRALRESIEAATDLQMRPAMAALGDDAEELIAILGRWSHAVVDAKAYMSGGPEELASGVEA